MNNYFRKFILIILISGGCVLADPIMFRMEKKMPWGYRISNGNGNSELNIKLEDTYITLLSYHVVLDLGLDYSKSFDIVYDNKTGMFLMTGDPFFEKGIPFYDINEFPTKVVVPAPKKEKVYELSELDKRPRPIKQIAPNIPEKLKTEQVYVIFIFEITKEGTTRNVKVVKSDSEEIVQYVIEAVKKWRFEPGMKDGVPVNCRVRIAPPIRIRKKIEPVAGGDHPR